MADAGDIIDVMKQAAINAVEASQPAKFVFGIVMQASPLKIKIHDKLILDKQFLTLTRNVTNFKTSIKLGSGAVQTATINNELKKGEKVVLIKNKEASGYLVIDRVVRAK